MDSLADFKASDYPWLSHTTTLAEYVNPEYYDQLLQPYVFEAGADVDMLVQHVHELSERLATTDVLELGIGTGRVTDVLVNTISPKTYKAVDLSTQMVDFCREKYRNDHRMELIQSDSIQFLLDTEDHFDFAHSLWSFSHSVHQNLLFEDNGAGRVRRGLRRLVTEVLRPGGTFFLIHVDTLSDEQRILTRQWNRSTQVFTDGEQSPSKQHIDSALLELVSEGRATVNTEHHTGKKIRYASLENAMETFLNFHLESYFNDRSDLPEVFTQVQDYLGEFVKSDGTVEVAPGCFVYQVTRIPE